MSTNVRNRQGIIQVTWETEDVGLKGRSSSMEDGDSCLAACGSTVHIGFSLRPQPPSCCPAKRPLQQRRQASQFRHSVDCIREIVIYVNRLLVLHAMHDRDTGRVIPMHEDIRPTIATSVTSSLKVSLMSALKIAPGFTSALCVPLEVRAITSSIPTASDYPSFIVVVLISLPWLRYCRSLPSPLSLVYSTQPVARTSMPTASSVA